jgi:hypothetical protein
MIPVKSIGYGYIPTELFRPKTLFLTLRFPEDANKLCINTIYYLSSSAPITMPRVKELLNVPLKVDDIIGLRVALTPVDVSTMKITGISHLRSTRFDTSLYVRQRQDPTPWGYDVTGFLYIR